MSEPNTVDISAKAVAEFVRKLRVYSDDDNAQLALCIEALAAERDSLRSKLAEAERERDDAIVDRDKASMDLTNEQGRKSDDLFEAMNDLASANKQISALKVECDAALAELAKLRAEAEWRPISEAPQKASLFGSDVLLANSKQVTVGHPTRFDKDKFTMMSGKYTPPTRWRPLPSPPKDPAHD